MKRTTIPLPTPLRRPRNVLSDAQIHAMCHHNVVVRVAALIAGDLKGARLAAARELLAFTLLGHARQWPTCPLNTIGDLTVGVAA